MKNKLDFLYFIGFVMMAIGIVVNLINGRDDIVAYLIIIIFSVSGRFVVYIKKKRTMGYTHAFLSPVGGIISISSIFAKDVFSDWEGIDYLNAMLILMGVIVGVSIVISIVESIIYHIKNNSGS